jgi:mono/diheme cytochrome c family protein
VSDDYAGAVYRITHGERARAGTPASPGAGSARHGDPLESLTPVERAAAAARGRALYAAHDCASCHAGDAAAPGVQPVPLAGLSSRYGLDDLAVFLAAPTPPMPAFPLSERERRDLAVSLLEEHP